MDQSNISCVQLNGSIQYFKCAAEVMRIVLKIKMAYSYRTKSARRKKVKSVGEKNNNHIYSLGFFFKP